jgi:hypothetical protein
MSHIQEVIALKEKCIVFSQFIGMLALIEHDLKLQKIDFLVPLIVLLFNFLRDSMVVCLKRRGLRCLRSSNQIQIFMYS